VFVGYLVQVTQKTASQLKLNKNNTHSLIHKNQNSNQLEEHITTKLQPSFRLGTYLTTERSYFNP